MGGHPRRPRWAAGSAVALGGLACVVAASFRSLLIDPRSAVRSAADRWIRFAAPPGKTLASTVALDASAFLAFPAVVEMLDLKGVAAALPGRSSFPGAGEGAAAVCQGRREEASAAAAEGRSAARPDAADDGAATGECTEGQRGGERVG